VSKIEKNKMGGACSTYGDWRDVYRVLVGKPDGNRLLGKPRRRWEENIKSSGSGMWRVWAGSSWLRIGTVGGHL